jgi:hypothetical protein
MKTLFEKLKPETIRLIEFEASEYPATMERLTDEMKSIHSWGQLTITDASRLIGLIRPYTSFNIEALSNLFED